jgi:cytoskeletal protein CcmA (bactofilin family)
VARIVTQRNPCTDPYAVWLAIDSAGDQKPYVNSFSLREQLSPFRSECVNPGKNGVDMFKSKAPKNDQSTAAKLEEAVGRAVQPQRSVIEHPQGREPMTKAGTSSCIGSGMSIVGNIECNGPAQVYGRIKGELRASDLLICDGAQIDGSVIAQAVTVCGRVKGTIRAVRVKLQDGGAVEGDIFHRSLSIDENSLFEGSSRRVENPTESPSIEARPPQEEEMRSSVLAPYLQRVEASASNDWSESTAEPKH